MGQFDTYYAEIRKESGRINIHMYVQYTYNNIILEEVAKKGQGKKERVSQNFIIIYNIQDLTRP